MNDESSEPVAAVQTPDAPPLVAAPMTPHRVGNWRALAISFGAALLLLFALVALAPWWAPVLPWGPGAGNVKTALTTRLDALETAQQLSHEQAQHDNAALRDAVQRNAQRLGGLEQRPEISAADIAELRERIDKSTASIGDLTSRIGTVEHAVQTEATHQTSGAALALALLQVSDAVDLGRPFAAQYETLAGLAHGHPELAEAVAPLATPAKTGVATRAVMLRELHNLANALEDKTMLPPPTDGGWAGVALAKLRGLVRVRRFDGGPATGTAAEIDTAATALAGGDLAAAIAAVDRLTGAAAAAAAPWLRMAKQRLAVDTALSRLEALLAAGIQNSSGGAPPKGSAH